MEELEKNGGMLVNMFSQYSSALREYKSFRSIQSATFIPGLPQPYGDLSDYMNDLFGNHSTETLDKVDNIVKNIKQMLASYITGNVEKTFVQKSKSDISKISELMRKAINDTSDYGNGWYPDGPNFPTIDERHKRAEESYQEFHRYS